MVTDTTSEDATLRHLAIEEGQATLDRQIEGGEEINAKAISTLRLNVLLVGTVLAALSLLAGTETTPRPQSLVNSLFLFGGLLSMLSMTATLLAYLETSYRTGIAPEYLRTAIWESEHEKWVSVLILSYSVWIDHNEYLGKRDGFALFVSNLCLLLSLEFYAGGTVYGLYVGGDSLRFVMIFLCIVGVLTALSLRWNSSPRTFIGNRN